MIPGIAINATSLVIPPVQLYETAPVPLSVTEVPEHTVLDPVAPTVGSAFTVIVPVAVNVLQPPVNGML